MPMDYTPIDCLLDLGSPPHRGTAVAIADCDRLNGEVPMARRRDAPPGPAADAAPITRKPVRRYGKTAWASVWLNGMRIEHNSRFFAGSQKVRGRKSQRRTSHQVLQAETTTGILA